MPDSSSLQSSQPGCRRFSPKVESTDGPPEIEEPLLEPPNLDLSQDIDIIILPSHLKLLPPVWLDPHFPSIPPQYFSLCFR